MVYNISVHPDHVRVLKSPNIEGVRTLYAYVPLVNLPDELSMLPDPRVPKPNAVVKRIKLSLESDNGLFHILNRGITISAKSAAYDNSKEQLRLEIPEGDESYGILDGGHSYYSVSKVLNEIRKNGKSSSQFVKIEILTGVEEILGKIASARNFSKAVKEISLASYNKELDWFKAALGPIAKRVRWSENDPEPFDAMEYIQVVVAFDRRYGASEQPLEAYKNAGKCLDLVTTEEAEIRRLSPLIPSIVKLYDTIRLEWWDRYREPGEDGRWGRPGRRTEVKSRKRGTGRLLQFPALDQQVGSTDDLYHVEKGLVIPLVAAFRSLLDWEQEPVAWKADPFGFWGTHGATLVRKVMDASDQRDQNPHVVGRDKTVYEALYESVELLYLRSRPDLG